MEFTVAEKRRFEPLVFANVSIANENALNFEEWNSFNNVYCEANGYNQVDVESLVYSSLVQLQRIHITNTQWVMRARTTKA